jgi:4-alpha-glucanotransferase
MSSPTITEPATQPLATDSLPPLKTLQQLATLVGIQTHFTDAFGTTIEATPHALTNLIVLLLKLTTVPATPSEWEALLAQVAEAETHKALLPYFVLKPTAPPNQQRLLKIFKTPTLAAILQQSPNNSIDIAWALTNHSTKQTLVSITGTWQLTNTNQPKSWDIALQSDCWKTLAMGYYQFSATVVGTDYTLGDIPFFVSPTTCYLPTTLQQPEQKTCGIAAQLYGLTTKDTWGIGDFETLEETLVWANHQQVGAIGLNPIHEVFPHDWASFSPYSPSSRQFINALYVSLPLVAEYQSASVQKWATSKTVQKKRKKVQESKLVDYPAVGALKNEGLRHCFNAFLAEEWKHNTPRAEAFTEYCSQAGQALYRLAQYQAFAEYFNTQDATAWGWCVWEEAFRTPNNPAVTQLSNQLATDIQFYQYRQWVAHLQLKHLKSYCVDNAFPIGLYLDLAVGASLGSADVWANQALYVTQASVGCPPDAFNQLGQNWGLPPLHPKTLIEQRFLPFINIVKSIMQYAGAVRIDHAVALFHAFWIPTGATGQDGGYINYPTEALLAILAIESHINDCMVIGEDLGTVPTWVKDTLNAWHILSYKIMGFERQANGAYLPPNQYPAMALVTAATHDLPTIQGFWQGTDITLRHELALFPTEEAYQQEQESRPYQRQLLLDALIHNALMPEGFSHNQADYPTNEPLPTPIINAIQQFLAASPAKLHMVQLEDGLGITTQLNMPGTTTQHPNWRRKLPVSLEVALNASLAWRE